MELTLKSALQGILKWKRKNHTDTSNTSTTVKETHNSDLSEEVVYQEQIENTPFKIVGNKQRGYFLSMGLYRISDNLPTPKHVHTWLKENQWHVVGNMVVCMLETMKTLQPKDNNQ